MRDARYLVLFTVLALAGLAITSDFVANDRIKVFLYGGVAFCAEVSVDMLNDTCHSLDNNLIDGMVFSALVGGNDVRTVLRRDDSWYCIFYDNYDCNGDDDNRMYIPGGDNNLQTSGWHDRVHGLRCINEQY